MHRSHDFHGWKSGFNRNVEDAFLSVAGRFTSGGSAGPCADVKYIAYATKVIATAKPRRRKRVPHLPKPVTCEMNCEMLKRMRPEEERFVELLSIFSQGGGAFLFVGAVGVFLRKNIFQLVTSSI
jgi:hypothetical protein